LKITAFVSLLLLIKLTVLNTSLRFVELFNLIPAMVVGYGLVILCIELLAIVELFILTSMPIPALKFNVLPIIEYLAVPLEFIPE